MNNQNFFSPRMVNKTDQELKNYVENKSQFEEEALLAAIWELEKRNIDNEESKSLKAKIEETEKLKNEKKEQLKIDSNIIEDPNAPLLYRIKILRFYGALFSVFAGGILIAMNFFKLGDKKNGRLVILAGLTFSVLQVVLLNQLGTNSTSLTIPVSILGMYLLERVFWKKHIPSNLIYRKRKIWGALLVAVIIWIPIFYAAIMANEM